jgi:hypothetical protein
MEIVYQFNRDWKDIDGLIFCLRSYKRKMGTGIGTGSVEYLRTLFLTIPYCRDIYRGKGERDLSYRLIYAWYQVFPILAIKALHLWFDKGNCGGMIGSWCDVKYFCLFMEKISPYGLYDPLVAIVIGIANRQLRRDLVYLESNVSKWIVRECNHPELFSLFVQDWFRKDGLVENKRKVYRQMISGLSLRIPKYGFKARFSGIVKKKILNENLMAQKILEMPSLSVGEYVRAVVEGGLLHEIGHGMKEEMKEEMKEGIDDGLRYWIDYEWKRLVRTFPVGCHVGIAIVDLDLGIGLEALYNSLGFACIIAMKMKTNRILLAGSVPICIDISECNGFCSMIRLLWGHCENRGKSSMKDMGFLINEAGVVFAQSGLKIFVFSDRYFFNSFEIFSGDIIFWDMGSQDLSFGPFENNKNITYMSGYNSGLIRPFLEEDTDMKDDGKVEGDFLSRLLKTQYRVWNDSFDEFMGHIIG